MARVRSKKALKKSRAIADPVFDSNVEQSDLVLINRSNADYHTTVDDLTQGVGDALGIAGLVTQINKNEGDITTINGEITDINTEIGDINDIIGNVPGGGGGSSLPDQIQGVADDLAAHIVDNETRDTEIQKEQDAQDQAIAANDKAAKDNAAAIAKNTSDIADNASGISDNEEAIARLQGALIFRGSVDVTAAGPGANNPAGDPWQVGDFIANSAKSGDCQSGWGSTDAVTGGEYFAYDQDSNWGPVGSNAVVIPDPGDGELTVSAEDLSLIATTTGGNFTANKADATGVALKVNLKDKGGIGIGADGIEINVGGSGGISIDGNGDLIFDPSFPLPPSAAPNLQAVTDKGADSTNVITTAGVVSTGDQSASTFLHKDISKLAALPTP